MATVPVKNQQPKSPSYTRSSEWNEDLLKPAKADFISSPAIIRYFNSLIAREICFKPPSDINLALEYNTGRQRIAVSAYYLDRSDLFAITRL
jgi:hypothetical protein